MISWVYFRVSSIVSFCFLVKYACLYKNTGPSFSSVSTLNVTERVIADHIKVRNLSLLLFSQTLNVSFCEGIGIARWFTELMDFNVIAVCLLEQLSKTESKGSRSEPKVRPLVWVFEVGIRHINFKVLVS